MKNRLLRNQQDSTRTRLQFHKPLRHILACTMAIAGTTLVGCNAKSENAVAPPSPAPLAAAAPNTRPAPSVAPRNDCVQAMQQLRQCHQQAVAGGKASALQLEQSTTYLRRLEAWWQMDGGNPAIQATCSAMASDKDSCAPDAASADAEDSAMSEEHFRQAMKQFDAAGVPP